MLSKKLFVFPTNRAIREYIFLKKDQNQILPKTITIGELFGRVILPNRTKQIVDNDLRVLYLKEAIKNIEISKLGFSDNFTKLYSNSEYIFKFFNELNSEYKTIDDLEASDTYAFYLDHLEILNAIYQNYINILDKNNLVDNITLPLDYKINEYYLQELEDITIYYEGYFSTFEFDVICKMAQLCRINIVVTINNFNRKNIEMFEKIGLSLEENNEYTIDLSNKNIIDTNKIIDKEIAHNIFPVKQRITQMAVVKKSIVDMVNSGIDPSKIAVVLPDEKFHSYLKLFDNEKYFNFAMGNDINDSSIYKIASAINMYLTQDEPKYQYRIEYFDYDKEYLDKHIRQYWNKQITKEIFFELIEYIYKVETNDDIKEKLLEIKISLDNLLFKSSFELDGVLLKDGFKIFLTKIQSITLDDVHAGKVTVLGILESRAISYDGVIIIDFNDDKVPKRSIKDKFISSDVKKHSNLPTPTDRQDLQKYYYKRLIQRAKHTVITYVEDEQNSMSRFIKEIFQKPNIKYKEFSNILQNSAHLEYSDNEIIKDINLSHLEWSATSLKTYLECKRKFYLHYILKVKEHNISLKPAGYEVGQIIHEVLERLYKENRFDAINLNNEISKYQNINPYLTLDLELWKKRLQKFVTLENDRLSGGIEVKELEKPFKIQYKGITLKGTVDRVDRDVDGKYIILDYKTSSSLKVDSAKTYEKSIDFQLEFYYLAMREFDVKSVAYYDLFSSEIKEEKFLEEKLKLLEDMFIALDTKSVNFKKCDETSKCNYCTYKILCNR
jgi:inactivated superfamily I helicase/RecB family exonuclease